MSSAFVGWSHLPKHQVSLIDVNFWKTNLPTHSKNESQRFSHIAGIAAKKQQCLGKVKAFKKSVTYNWKKRSILWEMPRFMMEHPDGENERTMIGFAAYLKKFHWLPKGKYDKELIKWCSYNYCTKYTILPHTWST